jgi:hypothetical protein
MKHKQGENTMTNKPTNDRDALLQVLHNEKHRLPNDRELCGRYAFISIFKYDDGTFGYTHSGMLPSADIVKAVQHHHGSPCAAGHTGGLRDGRWLPIEGITYEELKKFKTEPYWMDLICKEYNPSDDSFLYKRATGVELRVDINGYDNVLVDKQTFLTMVQRNPSWLHSILRMDGKGSARVAFYRLEKIPAAVAATPLSTPSGE